MNQLGEIQTCTGQRLVIITASIFIGAILSTGLLLAAYSAGAAQVEAALRVDRTAPDETILANSVFTVNSTLDERDAVPGNGICSSLNYRCTLRAAIMEANAFPGNDLIILPAGTYILSLSGDEPALGDLDFTSNLTITGEGPEVTIVDANGIDRVFDLYYGMVKLSGMTIRGGIPNGLDSSTNPYSGGGIRVNNLGATASLILDNVIVEDNYSPENGGGIFNNYSVQLNQVILRRNDTDGSGGGIHNRSNAWLQSATILSNTAELDGGGAWNEGTLTASGVILQGNSAGQNGGGFANAYVATLSSTLFTGNTASVYGGGLSQSPAGALNLARSTLEGNSASAGGGIGNLGGNATITRTIITANTATNAGGIYNPGSMTVEFSKINANLAEANAGGIYLTGTMAMNAVVIHDNSANVDGGGMYLIFGASADLNNVTVSANQAVNGDGGGIWVDTQSGLDLVNTSIVSNTSGGGLFYFSNPIEGIRQSDRDPTEILSIPGEVRLHNTLLAFNNAANCYKGSDAPSLVSLGYNLETEDSCDLDPQLFDQINVFDPRIQPLADYGGDTLSHALNIDSPAVDSGDNQGCPPTDQRGYERPENEVCDIGAYEYEYGVDLIVYKQDNPDPVNSSTQIVYTLLITNNSIINAPEVMVTDVLPVEVRHFSFFGGSDWSCYYADGNILCERDTFPAGISSQIIITVTAPYITGTNVLTMTNVATVSSPKWEIDSSNNTFTQHTTVKPWTPTPTQYADLAVQLQAEPQPVLAAELFTVTASLMNYGPNSGDSPVLTVTLPVDAIFQYNSGFLGCTPDPGIVVCAGESLEPGVTGTNHIHFLAPNKSGLMVIEAQITSRSIDPDLDNNVDGVVVEVLESDLSLVKTGPNRTLNPGETIFYTLTVTNLGPSPTQRGITVTDFLPQGVDFLGWSGVDWNCYYNSGSRTLMCTRGPLGVTAAPPIYLSCSTPDGGGVVTNTAQVTTPGDGTPANNRSSALTNVRRNTVLPFVTKNY